MSLDHILLGLLHKPASGYDLKRAFDESIRHFWSAKLSQIYPTLDRLERAAHVRSKKVASAKGPDRRVFRRTAAGRRELLKWLRSGPQLGAERFAYVAQLAFMHELQDLKHTREFVGQLKVRLTELHRFFTAMEQDELRDGIDALSAEEFHGYLSLRMGLHALKAKIKWCDESLLRIDERRKKDPAEGR